MTDHRSCAVLCVAALALVLPPDAVRAGTAVMLGGNASECDIARALLGSAPPECPPPVREPPPAAAPEPPPPSPPVVAAPAAPPAPVTAAAPPPPVQEERRVAFQIQFDLGSARIRPESREVLDRVARIIASNAAAGRRFHIVGHTDSSGTPAGNMILSRKRAEAVRDYFVTVHHIDAARLSAQGHGQTAPLDPTKPDDPLNRRVEIIASLP